MSAEPNRAVLFCHGLESGPHGYKYRSLRAAGYEVSSPDCRGRDLQARVDVYLRQLTEGASAERARELAGSIVVGSSFGGIAGLIAVIEAHARGYAVGGLLLCAPALELRQPPADRMLDEGRLRAPVPTVVIHGRGDDVIPIAVSRRFAARSDHDARVRLVEVDDGHGLRDSHAVMLAELARLRASIAERGRPT